MRHIAQRYDAGVGDATLGGAQTDAGVETQRLRGALASRLFGVEADPVRIGRFDIREKLGQGGMGTVYRAHDAVLDRMIAIKVVSLPFGRGSEVASRSAALFRKEAQTLAKLAHPNVLEVLDVGESDGQTFIAMALVDGGTVLEWSEATPLSAPGRGRRTLQLFEEAALGLAAAHQAGVVHRDIKPSNMLLDGHGAVQLADFGLAQSDLLEPERTGDTDAGAAAESARVSGTPAFMAPEQYGGHTDERSDQFSLCASFWQVAAGVRPFSASTLPALMMAICEAEPHAPAPKSRIPGWFAALLRRGMSKNPKDRFESVDALLLEFRRGKRTTSRKVGVAVAVALLAGVGVVAAGQSDDERCASPPADIAQAWTSEHVETLRAGLATAGAEGGGVLEDVSAGLNAYADRWGSAWTAACSATWVDETQTHQELDLRMRCLGRGKAAFLAVADSIDAEAVSAMKLLVAGTAVAALPDPDRCDAAMLSNATALPDDPELNARIAALDDQIATLRARKGASTFAEMRAVLPLEADVEATGYPPLQIAWAVRAAGYYTTQHDEAAMVVLERALEIAETHELFGDAVALASMLSEVSLEFARDEAGAERYIRHGESLLSRVPDARHRDIARSDLFTVTAMLREHQGRSEDALRAYDEALALIDGVFGPNSREMARVLGLQGATLRKFGNYDRARVALERALQLRQAQAGARLHEVELNSALLALAVEVGDGPTAVRHATQGVADSRELSGPKHANTVGAYGNMAAALVISGDDAGALAAMRKAVGALDGVPRGDVVQVNLRANLAIATDDFAEGERLAAAALDIATEEFGVDSFAYANALAASAAVAKQQGKLVAAVAGHEEALAAFERLGRARRVISTQVSLVPMLVEVGRTDDARVMIADALKRSHATYGADSSRNVTAYLAQARVQHADGDDAAALASLAQGRKLGEGVKDRQEQLTEIDALRRDIEG